MRRSSFCTLAAMSLATPWAFAQPSGRVMTIVVPYSAGGGYDRIARLVHPRLAEAVRQTVLIENRPGAGGTLGMAAVARAAPDGRTLVVAGPGDVAIAPAAYSKLSYDTRKDFVPLVMLARFALVLVTRADLNVRTLPAFLQMAKARNTPLMCATSAVGSTGHLSAELFRNATGIQMTMVPYKGTAPALTDMAGGHVDMMFTEVGSVLPFITAGKLSALAVTTESRSAALPDVPTMGQAGLPNYVVSGWWGLFAPAGTPAPVAQQLSEQVVAILKSPEIEKEILGMHAEPAGVSGEAFARVVEKDIVAFGNAARAAGVKLD